MSSSLIRRDFERVSPEIVRAASKFQAAILADMAGRRGTMHSRIRAMNPAMKVAGPAFTVEVRPGDNLMVHAALALAQPGDVIVVDGKGDQTCALIGSIMTTQARLAKFGGWVIDAAVRDCDDLATGDFPVFCAGTNPNGPTKFVPGRINWAISCGDIAVNPGDLIVGDGDGVVVIERERAAEVVAAAQSKVDAEAQRMKEMHAGLLVSPWLDDALRAAGVLAAGQTLL